MTILQQVEIVVIFMPYFQSIATHGLRSERADYQLRYRTSPYSKLVPRSSRLHTDADFILLTISICSSLGQLNDNLAFDISLNNIINVDCFL